MTEEYNGFKGGRETWAAKLHMDNDEGLYNEYRRRVVDLKYDVYEIATWLQEWVDDLNSLALDGVNNRALRLMFDDIGSTWRINYREIAESIVEDGLDDLDVSGDIEVRMDTYVTSDFHNDQSHFKSYSGSAPEILLGIKEDVQLSKFTLNSFDGDDENFSMDWGGVSLIVEPKHDMEDEDKKMLLMKLHYLLGSLTCKP